MKNNEQYIEPLIKIVELNADKYWLPAFLNLRTGGYLPGGGAGSLNDWGPSYIYPDPIKNVWYKDLYFILRYFYDNNLPAEQISIYRKFNNNIMVLRCLNCNNRYQHPNVFESHISTDFYRKNFVNLVKSNSLFDLFNPELTYKSSAINEYRSWLKGQYEANNIKIHDFLNKYFDSICPHCGKCNHRETEHDLYGIKDKIFQLQKQNAHWKDFEREY